VTAPPAGIVLRDATPHDAARIAEIHVRTWQVAYRGQLPDEFLDAIVASFAQRIELRRAALERPSSPRERTRVAERAGRIVGFAVLGPCRDDDGRQRGEVYAIYVEPESWGTGAGRALFFDASSGLRSFGYREATLWVLASNLRARRFYERAGWKHDGATRVEHRGSAQLHEVRYRSRL